MRRTRLSAYMQARAGTRTRSCFHSTAAAPTPSHATSGRPNTRAARMQRCCHLRWSQSPSRRKICCAMGEATGTAPKTSPRTTSTPWLCAPNLHLAGPWMDSRHDRSSQVRRKLRTDHSCSLSTPSSRARAIQISRCTLEVNTSRSLKLEASLPRTPNGPCWACALSSCTCCCTLRACLSPPRASCKSRFLIRSATSSIDPPWESKRWACWRTSVYFSSWA